MPQTQTFPKTSGLFHLGIRTRLPHASLPPPCSSFLLLSPPFSSFAPSFSLLLLLAPPSPLLLLVPLFFFSWRGCREKAFSNIAYTLSVIELDLQKSLQMAQLNQRDAEDCQAFEQQLRTCTARERARVHWRCPCPLHFGLLCFH